MRATCKAFFSKLLGAARRRPHAAEIPPTHAGEALIQAAATGDLATVQALLHSGVDMEARNAEGRTALMLAAHGGHTAVVHALSAAGADIDVRDARNWSALMIAAQAGQLPVVQALAHAGKTTTRKKPMNNSV